MSFPKDFAGTEHYREKPKKFGVENPFVGFPQYQHDITALCDHIDWQQCHIEALDVALRASGERRAAVEKKVEDLEGYINRAIKQLYDGLDMFDHDMRFFAENAIEILGKAVTKEKP